MSHISPMSSGRTAFTGSGRRSLALVLAAAVVASLAVTVVSTPAEGKMVLSKRRVLMNLNSPDSIQWKEEYYRSGVIGGKLVTIAVGKIGNQDVIDVCGDGVKNSHGKDKGVTCLFFNISYAKNNPYKVTMTARQSGTLGNLTVVAGGRYPQSLTLSGRKAPYKVSRYTSVVGSSALGTGVTDRTDDDRGGPTHYYFTAPSIANDGNSKPIHRDYGINDGRAKQLSNTLKAASQSASKMTGGIPAVGITSAVYFGLVQGTSYTFANRIAAFAIAVFVWDNREDIRVNYWTMWRNTVVAVQQFQALRGRMGYNDGIA